MEVVVDAELGGVWFNKTLWQVISIGVNGSNPGEICNDVRIKDAPYPVLIVIDATYPPCGLNRSLQVANKRQSTSPGLGGNTQKLDAVINGKLPDGLESASFFNKVIGHKSSDGSSNDLYWRCRMNFVGDVVQTQTPQFMDLGISTSNALDESCVLGTPATSIQRPTDESHWSAPDHVFGEDTAVRMSKSKSDHDYNYYTDFSIWRENREFEHQNISMSQTPLELTPIGMNTKNTKLSHLDSTPIGTKTSEPKLLT